MKRAHAAYDVWRQPQRLTPSDNVQRFQSSPHEIFSFSIAPRSSVFTKSRGKESETEGKKNFGDEDHRLGHCLYRLGCKGPVTHANCSTLHFCDVPGAWPIGIGHPCVGCTEQQLAFQVPMHTTVDIERPTPPDTYPPIHAEQGNVGAVATGVAGLVGGALLGAGWMAAKKLGDDPACPRVIRTVRGKGYMFGGDEASS